MEQAPEAYEVVIAQDILHTHEIPERIGVTILHVLGEVLVGHVLGCGNEHAL
jgi:hypothetical protein